jgi:pre-mRNA-processing factor 39
MFELEQPTSATTEAVQYQRIKQVIKDIRTKSTLPSDVVKELVQTYMVYLLERGTRDAAKEYMTLDREVHGSVSVQATTKAREPSKAPQNGNQPVPVVTTDPVAAVAVAQPNQYAYYQQHTASNGGVRAPGPHF